MYVAYVLMTIMTKFLFSDLWNSFLLLTGTWLILSVIRPVTLHWLHLLIRIQWHTVADWDTLRPKLQCIYFELLWICRTTTCTPSWSVGMLGYSLYVMNNVVQQITTNGVLDLTETELLKTNLDRSP